MSSIIELSQPAAWPVDLTTAKNWLKLPSGATPDDSLISTIIIPGATRQLENALGICLANRKFKQSFDGFPFFPYFMSAYAPLFGAAFPFFFSGFGPISQMPYPSGVGLPDLISPFVKHFLRSPVTKVDHISYIGTDGKLHGMLPGKDFVVDFESQPARISPIPGQRWPVSIQGMNTVSIFFSAGYNALAASTIDILVGAIWQSLVSVPQGSYIIDPNGFVWIQLQANATTGETEPVWTSNPGDTISDGIVDQIPGGGSNVPALWKDNGKILGPWQPDFNYSQPAIIQDPNGFLQMLIVSNLTSQGSAPAFSQTFAQVTNDNGQAAWQNIGLDYSEGAVDPPDQMTEDKSEVIAIPENLYQAVLFLISHWYKNRDAVVGGAAVKVPWQLDEIIASNRDWSFDHDLSR